MKLCTAQIQPVSGDVSQNIRIHEAFILKAAKAGADLVLFPELSLTGYEPELAAELALTPADSRLTGFQVLSNTHHLTICMGMPVRSEIGICIGMVIFQANQPHQLYAKQHLHADELPYFVAGNTPLVWTQNNKVLTPAICYESLLPEHAEAAAAQGADIYLASVAKADAGLEKARVHYPAIARKYGMTVLLANSVGPCDNFVSTGGSAAWDANGQCKTQLNSQEEGILIFDTETRRIVQRYL